MGIKRAGSRPAPKAYFGAKRAVTGTVVSTAAGGFAKRAVLGAGKLALKTAGFALKKIPAIAAASLAVGAVGYLGKKLFGKKGRAAAEGGRRRKRTNPTNPKALRRAGSRIKSFLKMAHKIERSLPHSRASTRFGGSAGVITRREAASALRR